MHKPPRTRSELADVLFRLRRSFFALAAFSGVINVMMLTPAIYMLQVYDRALVSRNVTTLTMLTLLVIGLFMLMSALEMVRTRVLIRVGNFLDMDLNRRIFSAAFERNLSRAGGNPAQALQDLAQVRQFLTGNGLFAFFDAPWTPIYLLVCYLIHPLLGLVTLIGSLILVGLAYITEKATQKPLAEANQAALSSASYANNNLRNAEVIEAMGMLPAIGKRWFQGHLRILQMQTLASDRAAIISSTGRFVRITLQSVILGAGALLAIEGKITPGMMIACSILTGRALAPVEQVIAAWKQLQGSRSAWGRLNDLLHDYPQRPPSMSLQRPMGMLAVENVVAGAPGTSNSIVRGVSFSLVPGESLGIIGPSASGKSTLARLLVGVWPTQAGKVRLDGADIFTWNKAELGPWLGYLPQDVELFEGTIAENIARFAEVDSEAVIRAARSSGVHDMILRFPQGYDTRLAADGSPLSGGQKQRIALARALYGEPNLVVLDEPNANLDDVGEKALVDALAELKARGATVILISHRPNVLCAVDKVLMLRDGAVHMLGSRDEVFAALRKASVIPTATAAPLASVKVRE
ncbi:MULTISPECIES: type I secretion system permease/ATPase [Pseudomonas]|jgi:ATP-binding cassette subfamily C exporter for protease/lipase|uniref:type I secretion system permease/ATPase n=1 Tax=Pseudomonas TaxID=286 RepID=UPI000C23C951|nr:MULTISPECIES: type I secretion system permease/ATPase [Pseudomonas]CAB5627653.1 Type I secretion system ATP-binding protein PrsD [Pseudomonas putida]GJB80757.1 alkaline protease secretion ATP-binding protein AprD [Aeromonas caviae]MBO2922097.1 type I secretion system permease/ATPase [Pseudomonas asiatica]MCO7527152.1 type I secretion system permease/ATPase [Pseudomonas asiatica]PJI71810.1 type I secretion system permease/ATPase [Pseudomonas sp. MR 02]